MKKIISLLISLFVLALIYWKTDVRNLAGVLAACHPGWMVTGLGMVFPLTFLTAWRLKALMPDGSVMGLAEAVRLILVASVLNLVLPSKMGDIAKAWFMRDRGGVSAGLCLAVVVFEKTCDMASLLLWCLFGLCFYPVKDVLFGLLALTVVCGLLFCGLLIASKMFARLFFGLAARFLPAAMGDKMAGMNTSWREMHEFFWAQRRRAFSVLFLSLFIWFLHLVQIWFFILALRAWCPFNTNLALSPLAILAGLLPLTFAGVGTRDAALVILYAPYFSSSVAAALGLLCTARYILPALGGAPFAGVYFQRKKTEPTRGV